MKTKIMSLFVMGLLMFSFMAVGVLAQESSSDVSSSDTVSTSSLVVSSSDVVTLATSDEDIDSSSGIFGDKMKSWFTFNKEKKARIKMRIAKKRMFEIGDEARNNPEKAKEIAKEYESELNDALDNFDQIAVDGDKTEVIRALKRTVIVKFKLENHKVKSSEIHEKILENKADQMTDDQLNHLEEVFSTIEDHIDSSIERVEQTQENLEARLITLGVEESLIDERMNSFESVLQDKMQQRQEHMQDILVKMREHHQNFLHNSNFDLEGSAIDSAVQDQDVGGQMQNGNPISLN